MMASGEFKQLADSVEQQFTTNHLNHFLPTNLLIADVAQGCNPLHPLHQPLIWNGWTLIHYRLMWNGLSGSTRRLYGVGGHKVDVK
ncbi:hypothetical protein F5B20DRAFT_60467 [Whalleya microplaca]|nr:hypothetical protein F5B20DRAFT_60467 [Whalleya microplaca]